MGLRDAADIAGIVRDALASAKTRAHPRFLTRYETARRSRYRQPHLRDRPCQPVAAQDFLPVQTARAAGLHLIGAVGPLRRLAMRERRLAPS